MSVTKRKISVTLDEDLISELEVGDQSLSALVNMAVRAELERRVRQRRLVELLDRLDDEKGPVTKDLIEKYVSILE